MPIAPDSPLDALSAVSPRGGGRFEAAVPAQWNQGRGAFGGLVVAMLVRALEALDPARPLRSLTAELCGPVQPGRADIQVEVLRRGSAVSTAAARLVQGEVQAHAVGVLGADRATDLDSTPLPAPHAPSWRTLEPLPLEGSLAPEFARHFEFRTTHLPFGDTPSFEAWGWIRPRRPGTRRDAAYLAACIDAWWPVLFMHAPAPRPMATVAFTLQILDDFDGLDPDAPLLHRARLLATRHGYAAEQRELWGEDGRLLAVNQQTIAVIK